MNKNYVRGTARVGITIDYCVKGSKDVDSEFLFKGLDIVCVEETSIIEGTPHYSYSDFELTENSIGEVKELVEQFIEENGYMLVGYEFDIDSWDFMC